MGPFGELSTAKQGSEVPGVVPEDAPNVSARGAHDVDMGDEVAQRRQIQRPGKSKIMC